MELMQPEPLPKYHSKTRSASNRRTWEIRAKIEHLRSNEKRFEDIIQTGYTECYGERVTLDDESMVRAYKTHQEIRRRIGELEGELCG